jgi:hypothetical protein
VNDLKSSPSDLFVTNKKVSFILEQYIQKVNLEIAFTEKIRGSLLFRMRLCQRWRFTLALTNPIAVSAAASPPTMTGMVGRKPCKYIFNIYLQIYSIRF